MPNIDGLMTDMLASMDRCHVKAKAVHMAVAVLHIAKSDLQQYKALRLDGFPASTRLAKPFSFRLELETTNWLCGPLGPRGTVSISVPPDANNCIDLPFTIEIALFDEDSNIVSKVTNKFTDIHRFSSVAELVVFLDKMADGRFVKDADNVSEDESSEDEA